MLDQFVSDMFEFDDDTVSFFDKTNILEKLNIPLERVSKDGKNNTAYWLVDTCKSNNLFIISGRFGKDRGMGAQTFRYKSVIDYTLCTAESFEILNEFEVVELDSIFSNGHALLSWSIACNLLMNKTTEITHNYIHNFQWSENSKDLFISINKAEIIDLQERLEHATTQLAFYVKLHRAVIGPSATLTGR